MMNKGRRLTLPFLISLMYVLLISGRTLLTCCVVEEEFGVQIPSFSPALEEYGTLRLFRRSTRDRDV